MPLIDAGSPYRGLFQGTQAAIAAILAGVAAAFIVWVFHSGFPKNGFLFLYPPVIGLVTYFGGRRPGLVTALVGVITAWYFIIPPAYSFSIDSDALPILVVFAVVSVLTVEGGIRLRGAEAAERALALVVECSDDAIFSKSLDGTILTWNAGAERLYGYAAAEVVGQLVSMLAPPDRANEMSDILMRLRRGERVDHYESVRIRKDGTRVEVSLTVSPVRDRSGMIIGAATIARDITERKRAEQALRRRKADDELINAIATRTAGETQLDRLLAVALEQLQQRIVFTGGSIALIEGGDLVVRAAIGPFADAALGQRMRRGQGRTWGIVEACTPFLCNDLLLEELKPTTSIRSYLAAPLIWQGGAFGVLEVDSPDVGAFGQADLELLQRVAAVISGSIELARRYTAEAGAKAEAEAARQETAVLYEAERRARGDAERAVARAGNLQTLTAALSEALTVPDVARICAGRGAAAVQARASIVSLLDATGEWLGIVAYTDYRPEDISPWLRCRVNSLVPLADCIRSGQPIFLETPDAIIAAYPDFTREDLRRFGDWAWISLPLVVSDRAIGTLFLAFAQEHPLSPEDRRLALTIVQQCAQALDRARLYEAERTAREEAEGAAERIARLQAITGALSGTLTPAAVAEVIVDQGLVALRAQAGSLALLTDDGVWLELVQAIGYPQEFVERWRRTSVSTRVVAGAAIRTREPIFLESRDALLARYGAPSEPVPVLPDPGARAVIPLATGRDVIGVLSFLFSAPKSFTEDERVFIQTIARQCALVLERARLYEREHHVAETLQRALLPVDLPQVPGIEIHAVYVPGTREAEVGGDWYDAFQLPDGHIALAVGDVVGRGLQAAVIMGQLRQAIRAAALEGHSPFMVLSQASKILQLASPPQGMATAIFGVLDPIRLRFTYAVAGHPAPVFAADDGIEILEPAGSLPLGITGSRLPTSRTVSLSQGSLLVLYTDGLIELTRSINEGEAALVSAVGAERERPSADPAQAILDRVLSGRKAADDIAIVTLSIASWPLQRLTLTLPAEPASVRDVRHAFRHLVQGLGLDKMPAAMFEVALGEAVNNVVEHAYGLAKGNFRVRVWHQEDTLLAEVEDHGRWREERNEGRGYGLQIMRAVLDSVEVQRGESGTVVRLVLSGVTSPHAQADRSVPAAPRSKGTAQEEVGAAGKEQRVVFSSMRRDVQFQIEHVASVPVVKVGGAVDLGNAHELEAALEHAGRTDKRAVVVDLTGASYLDSKAVLTLLRLAERFRTNRQRLLIVIPQDHDVRRVLEIAGVMESLPVFVSVDDALAGDCREK
jgi:anti-anti-sigma factor